MRGARVVVLALVVGCGAGAGAEARSGSGSGAAEGSGARSASASATLRRINVEALCHAEVRSDAVRVGGEEKVAQIRHWLGRQLAHEEVRTFALEELPTMTASGQAAALTKMAEDGGLKRCPLAELWAWEADRGPERASCEDACELRLRATTMEARAECELGCRGTEGEL